jgi:hypothetical protein
MHRLPDAVVALLANAFLDDCSALRLARSSRILMHALRSTYRLKLCVELPRASKWTAKPAAVGAASSSSSSAPPPSLPPLPSPLRIGLVVAVRVPRADAQDGRLQSLLDRLPRSVQRMIWNAKNGDDDDDDDNGDGDEDEAQSVRLPAQLRELVDFEFDAPAADVRLPPLSRLSLWVIISMRM